MNIEPLVSIVCLTYNEEAYVRDTFDNFLSQETDFAFEVLVYDDASQDNTPNIIKEYVEKYPDIFKATLYEENNFKKGLGFYGLRVGFNEAKGKYIAYCEGDDYWCDNHKLQKQVDFLESHPEYEVCAHETVLRNDRFKQQDGVLFSVFNKNLFIAVNQSDYSFEDTLTGNIFHISGLMFRNSSPINWPTWINTVSACDMVMYMLLGERGKIHWMPEIMSVYRDHSASITNSYAEYHSSVGFYEMSIKILDLMNEYWNSKYQNKIFPLISRYYMRCMFVYLSKRARNYSGAITMCKLAWKYDSKTCIKYSLVESVNKIRKHL